MSSNQGLDALAALASAVSGYSNPSQGGSLSNGTTGTLTTPTPAALVPPPQVNTAALPSTSSSLLTPLSAISPHHWQQAVTAAAASINNMAGVPNMALLSGMPPVNQANPVALLAFQQQLAMQQQMNYYQMLAQQQQQQQQQQQLVPNGGSAVTGALVGSQPQTNTNVVGAAFEGKAPGLLASAGNMAMSLPIQDAKTVSTMPLPQTMSASSVAIPSPPQNHTAIAPQPNRRVASSTDSLSDHYDEFEEHGDKRQLKRVANRRSAQLSRKRKKQFIEELKDENDSLRRKEQILMSIPDLIVVFDSSGKLWFVSESVSRFLDYSVEELEGTSFWNRLCDDSIRLLKAAFMDSLAARQPDSETAPLGTGFWKLRLVDKDGSSKVVTLNGVVHFAGDRPECVCSIRPHEESDADTARTISRESSLLSSAPRQKSLIEIMPQQSVVNDRIETMSPQRRNGKEAVRISDSGNSSGSSQCSDSGSSDEQNIDEQNVDVVA